MVHDKISEEALLLEHHSDDRTSLDAALTESNEKSRRRSFSHFAWLRAPRLPRSRSPLVSNLRRRIHLNWSQPRRRWPARLVLLFTHAVAGLLLLILVCCLFFPSYSNPPKHYTNLRKAALQSRAPGRANPHNEKVFIAASLRDKKGHLVSGDWGRNVLSLVDLLGPENVFLSIYENDPDETSVHALSAFERKVKSTSSIVHEHLDLRGFDRVIDMDGNEQLKRIAVLAEVRNRALRPLEYPFGAASHTQWDKLLYLNDVMFDPVDAANLLFNTNLNPITGRADYRAACAVDFINAFKFYDTYATRDLEGNGIGVPFYPFFASAGEGETRRDVLSQTDAVRVKSCWGGMVAFEAKWFQPDLSQMLTITAPTKESLDRFKAATSSSNIIRFRSEPDTYWDASECCLIHADLAHLTNPTASPTAETGIYMNPYIRVAYKTSVLNWLPFIRRFERLYSPFQSLSNRFAGLPNFNPRRLEQPGDEVVDTVWEWDEEFVYAVGNGTVDELDDGPHGQYVDVKRVATPGQFCGIRKLSVVMDVWQTGRRFGAAEVPAY